MKYNSDQYAQSLIALCSRYPNKRKQIMSYFVKLLWRQGDLYRAKDVLAALRRRLLKEKKAHHVVIASARLLEPKKMKQIQSPWDNNSIIETKVNPALIAGVEILVDGEWVIDGSLRRQLNRLG